MLSSHLKGEEFDTVEGSHESGRNAFGSPTKRRSLSDCSVAPPALSPSPKFHESDKRHTTQDDIDLFSPTTPRRPATLLYGLSVQLPPRDSLASSVNAQLGSTPLSPKVDHSSTYASPSSAIPRRSRGLDFSRAATNLHHSTLAEQPSPDSSPTMSGRAMNIPNRRGGPFNTNNEFVNGATGSLWSTMASAERNAVSSSLGSVNMFEGSSGSSSEDEDLMDADEIDESILTTPQVKNLGAFGMNTTSPGTWSNGPSSAMSNLMNFQRHKTRAGKDRKSRSNLNHMHAQKARSPPLSRTGDHGKAFFGKELGGPGILQRRESISWAANQLHISGSESDDNPLKTNNDNLDGSPSTPNREGQRGVIKRAVTRRGNMLPKTKGFARIRAALAEEGAPIENDARREADVIRQVREADPVAVEDLEPRYPPPPSSTTQSSPMFGPALSEALEDIPEDDMAMGDSVTLSSDNQTLSSFKQHLMRNSKVFWESQEDHHKTTPPPTLISRGSFYSDDLSMATESPSASTSALANMPSLEHTETMSSSGQSSTPQPPIGGSNMPSAAEITKRVNNKRRRDDDFDPSSFKRRAVSPGMSVHNSPVMQSPMQRDVNPWGGRLSSGSQGSGSVIGEGKGGEGALSHKGSVNAASNGLGPSKRVGLQGMVDTNDGLMKMSIE